MAIDYSKWDKIELSDDSDIEVHPNVDKRSFIRWKQQSIHEQRAKRNQDINNFEHQLKMYEHLNRRVDKMMQQLSDSELLSLERVTKFLNENFDKTERLSGDNVDPDLPPFNEMVEDLMSQLEKNAKDEGKDPNDGAVIREMMQKHREKIAQVTKEAKEKLESLYKEKSIHISSEDIHTGFDRSFINKNQSAEDEKKNNHIHEKLRKHNQEAGGEASTLALSDSLTAPKPQFIEYEDDPLKLAPETEKFGDIPYSNYKESESFLLKHLPILSEQQKDALMLAAFEHQLDGDTKKAYQVIHQSELLSYIREIYTMKKIPYLHEQELSEVIRLFFQRVFYKQDNLAGKKSFLDSVQTKYEHVKQRCKLLAKEREEEREAGGVETIQLKSLDDSTELKINLPDFSSDDVNEIKKVKAFNSLPKEMQDAVKTKSLDAINEVFANMPIAEAEKILDIFNEGEIIGVNALLENEDEFKELQEQYNNEKSMDNLTIESSTENQAERTDTTTADIVD